MVSVIIPVNNGMDFLPRCLNSVLEAIDKERDEILIIDDASTDATGKICDCYIQDYPEVIRYFRLKEMSGPSASRNLGLEYARGEYISFIDSDDYIEPNMISCLLVAAERDQADMVCCGYCLEEMHKKTTFAEKEYKVLTVTECLRELLNNENIGNYVWNKLYKRSIFDQIKFAEGEIYEDIRIMYRLIGACERIVVIPDCLYHYLKRRGSLTYRPSDEELLLQYRVIQERNDTIRKKHVVLKKDVDCNTLKKSVFIYSRLAKAHGWKECREQYSDIWEGINQKKKYLKNIPFKYRILGNLIVYLPSFHGRIMYGK